MPIWLLLLLGGVGVAAVASASSKTSGTKAGGVVPAPPYPYKAYPLNVLTEGSKLPPASPTGSPWVMWQGSKTYPFLASTGVGHGIDRDGVQWAFYPGGPPGVASDPAIVNLMIRNLLGRSAPTIPESIRRDSTFGVSADAFGLYDPTKTGGGFASAVFDALNNYVVPAIAVAIGSLVGGVGGIVAAAAWTAYAKIARGIPITQALINGAQDALPSLLESGAFDQALDLYRKNPALVNAARSVLSTPDARTAFDAGLVFAKAEKYQKQAIDALKKSLPADAAKIQYALDNGAQLLDVANAYAGASGVNLVNQIVTQR